MVEQIYIKGNPQLNPKTGMVSMPLDVTMSQQSFSNMLKQEMLNRSALRSSEKRLAELETG